jgi:glycine dehydrogenase subunit 2
MLEEALLFEIGDMERTGVDFADARWDSADRTWPAQPPIGLAGLTEPEAVRHYTRCPAKIMRSTWPFPARLVHDEA